MFTVVSANGQHQNPDTDVMRTMIAGRDAAAPDVPFTVWFTCAEDRAPSGSRASMKAGLDASIAAAHKVNERNPGLV
jgi:hypothetical protein